MKKKEKSADSLTEIVLNQNGFFSISGEESKEPVHVIPVEDPKIVTVEKRMSHGPDWAGYLVQEHAKVPEGANAFFVGAEHTYEGDCYIYIPVQFYRILR